MELERRNFLRALLGAVVVSSGLKALPPSDLHSPVIHDGYQSTLQILGEDEGWHHIGAISKFIMPIGSHLNSGDVIDIDLFGVVQRARVVGIDIGMDKGLSMQVTIKT